MTLTALQCRMARVALDWTVRQLARQAGLSLATVSRFENGQSLAPERAARLRDVFTDAGIVLVEEDEAAGAGLRLSKTFRKGFIFDGEGRQVASILGQTVVDSLREQTIGRVEGDGLYTLAGEPIGLLQTVDTFQHAGSLSDPAIRLLLDADPAPSVGFAPEDSEGTADEHGAGR